MAAANQAHTALEYILSNVLGERATRTPYHQSPFRAAFEAAGIADINDFLIIEEDDWKDLEIQYRTVKTEPGAALGSPPSVKSMNDVTRKLSLVERRKLTQLKSWHADYGRRNPNVSPVAAWICLDTDVFTDWLARYQASPVQPARSDGGGEGPTVSNSPSSKDESTKLLESFTRSIKRDQSDYKPFKEDKYWLAFKRNLLITARAQNIERIFDLGFDRDDLSGADQELYDLQLKYGYAVLTKIVQTSQGKVYVRQHAIDGDATAVLHELVEYYTHSRVAEIAAQEVTTKINTIRMDSKWTAGGHAFLNHWRNLVLDLEEIKCEDINTTTAAQKRDWLIAALSTNIDMTNAITTWRTMDRMVVQSGTHRGTIYETDEVSFSNLWSHLETTAIDYDTTHKVDRSKQRAAHRGETRSTRPPFNSNNRDKWKNDPWNVDSVKWAKMTPQQWSEHTKKRHEAKDKEKQATQANKAASVKADIKAEVELALKSIRDANCTTVVPIQVADIKTTSVNTAQQAREAAMAANPSPIFQSILRASKAAAERNSSVPNASAVEANTGSVVTDTSGKHVYWQICNLHRHYHVSKSDKTTQEGSLVDRGANGGLAGDDMKVIETCPNATADVTGITNNVAKNLKIVLGAGRIISDRGPIIGLFPQYAYLGKGKTIHSPAQLEAFGLDVDERPRRSKNAGRQCITTPDGYKIPLKIRNGLAYMDMSFPSDADMETYPMVYFAADQEWDPTTLDDEFEDFQEAIFEPGDDELAYISPVNDFGELTSDRESDIDVMLMEVNRADSVTVDAVKREKVALKFDGMRPNFLWVSAERIKNTLAATTQFARSVGRIPFRKHFKTRWPAANVNRYNDDVATDTFFRTPQL